MKRRLTIFAAVPLLLSLCVSAATAQDYQVRLTQTTKVGSQSHISATGSQMTRTTITADGSVLKNEEVRVAIELAADARVIAVDAKGRATGKSFKIITARMTKDGIARSLFPEGSILLATVERGKTVFQIDGKPIEDEVAKALRMVIILSTSEYDDDDLFGTRIRRKAGETWNVDAQAVELLLKEIGAQAKAEDIKGSTTLEKVEGKHLIVRGSVSINNAALRMPPGVRTERGLLRAELCGKFPLDGSDGSLEQIQKIFIDSITKRDADQNTPELTVNITHEATASFQIKSLR